MMWGRVAGVLVLILVEAQGASHGAGPACTWEAAASRYGVNPHVLFAIARQESGLNPRAINRNTDGTIDLGLMQINSRWESHLSRFGISRESLLDPCVNINIGAYILALSMRQHGNTWAAIGAYHSNTPQRREQYARQIAARLQRDLVGRTFAQRSQEAHR